MHPYDAIFLTCIVGAFAQMGGSLGRASDQDTRRARARHRSRK
jgi:hypothetical protein